MMWDGKNGPNPLVQAASEITIFPTKEKQMRNGAPEAPQTARVGVQPGKEHLVPDGEVPDAPESVNAGVPEPVREEDDSEAQAGGLSGYGSYEMARRMFGPPLMPSPDVAKAVE